MEICQISPASGDVSSFAGAKVRQLSRLAKYSGNFFQNIFGKGVRGGEDIPYIIMCVRTREGERIVGDGRFVWCFCKFVSPAEGMKIDCRGHVVHWRFFRDVPDERRNVREED